MANIDTPKGFAPHGKVLRANPYVSGGAVYPGDFVRMDSSGRVVAVAAGETILGLALEYASAAGSTIMVCDDPEQRYVGQADETELDAQTDIGNNCDVLATAGNSTYKASRMEVDSSTVAAAAAQLTILGLEAASNNAFGAQAKVIVRINEHQIAGKDAFAGI